MRMDLLERLGTVRDDLDVIPLWSVAERVNRKNQGMQERNLLSLSFGSVIRRDIDEIGGLRPESYEGYNVIEAGDTVLRMTDLQNDQRSIRTGLAKERGIITSAYVTVRPADGVEPRFLAAVLRAYDVKKVYYEMGAGVRQTLKFEELAHLPVPLPSLAEQRRIAEYLDRETAEIDAMDAELNHLINTLRERAASSIENRLWGTGGRSVPMKLDCQLVTSGSRGWASYYSESGERFLRIADLNRGTHQLKDIEPQFVTIPANAEGSRSRTNAGDLLFSITAYLGSVGLVTEAHQDSYVSQHVALVRLAQRIWTPAFVAYAALSATGQRYLTESGYGGTKTQLNLDQVRDLPVPLLPIAEQQKIVRELDEAIARIDAMIADAQHLKALLAERRSTLITEVVTGVKPVPAEAAGTREVA